MSRAAVALAVRLLPGSLRDRYREQWNADLRDAEEAGIPPLSIATGALAFAATVSRPLPWAGRVATAETMERRAWLAAGLALGAAVLGVTRFASVAGDIGGLTGHTVYDFFVHFVAPGLFMAVPAIAMIYGIIIVATYRALDSRLRTAIMLLVLAALAPTLVSAVGQYGRETAFYGSPYLATSNLLFVLAAVAIVWSLALLRRARRAGSRFDLPIVTRGALSRAIGAGAIVLVIGAAPLIVRLVEWILLERPTWTYIPGLMVGIQGEDGRIVEVPMTREVWLDGLLGFEQRSGTTFVAWAGAIFVIAVATAVVVHRFSRSALWLTSAGVSLSLVVAAGVVDWLWMNGNFEDWPSPLLMIFGRLGLVAVALFGIGRWGKKAVPVQGVAQPT